MSFYLLRNKGFTLIELLVVVAIIGVLAAVGVTSYNYYMTSSNEKVCKENHEEIVDGIKLTYSQCKLGGTVKLRRGYSNFQQGSEYNFNCSTSLFGLVGSSVTHTANYLTNIYSPNNHWGYEFGGNTSTPNREGQTYWHVYDFATGNSSPENTFRVRTRCNGKIIEDIVKIN